MGQILVRPKSRDMADAALALERLVPMDVVGLAPGRQRYAFFTNESGGIIDDLMIAHRGDHFLLIVNAACKDCDEAHLITNLADSCEIEQLDRALIALQGPLAERALARIATGMPDMRFMDVRALKILGADCVAMRSGYTGEDGFEISLPSASAAVISSALLEDEGCAYRTGRARFVKARSRPLSLWCRHHRYDNAYRSQPFVGHPVKPPAEWIARSRISRSRRRSATAK